MTSYKQSITVTQVFQTFLLQNTVVIPLRVFTAWILPLQQVALFVSEPHIPTFERSAAKPASKSVSSFAAAAVDYLKLLLTEPS